MKPWEEMFLKLWKWATAGKRAMLTYPLFVVLFLLPATFGLWDSYGKAFAAVKSFLPQSPIELSADEHELLDQEEWGLIVTAAQSEADAARKRDDFKGIYSSPATRTTRVNSSGSTTFLSFGTQGSQAGGWWS